MIGTINYLNQFISKFILSDIYMWLNLAVFILTSLQIYNFSFQHTKNSKQSLIAYIPGVRYYLLSNSISHTRSTDKFILPLLSVFILSGYLSGTISIVILLMALIFMYVYRYKTYLKIIESSKYMNAVPLAILSSISTLFLSLILFIIVQKERKV